MAQYKIGTVTTNGTNQIVGSGSAWLTNASIGDLFWIQGQNAPYTIANVNTDLLITLTSAFGGPNAAGQSYVIGRSFTPNFKFPYPEGTDIDTHTTVKRFATMVDTVLGNAIGGVGQANRVVFTDANGNLSTAAGLATDGGAHYVQQGTGTFPSGGLNGFRTANGGATISYFDASDNTHEWIGGVDSGITYTKMGSFSNHDTAVITSNTIVGLFKYIASSTNYLVFAGANSDAPSVSVAGADTNIALRLSGKGSGSVELWTNATSARQVVVQHTASASRYITLTGSNGGNPTIGISAGSLAIASDDVLVGASGTARAKVSSDGTNVYLQNSTANPILFYINGAEVARNTAGGYLKASNSGTYDNATGTYHELDSNANGYSMAKMVHSHATGPNGLWLFYSAGAPNDTGHEFLYCSDNVGLKFAVLANGGKKGFSANDVNLSDGTIKVGMVPAPDYCDFVEKAAALIKIGAYEDDPEQRMHTMWDSREIEALDESTITPWQHSPLMVLKGLRDHEMYLRGFAATGALIRRLKVVEQRLGIQ